MEFPEKGRPMELRETRARDGATEYVLDEADHEIVVTRNAEGGWSGTCNAPGLTPDDHATLVLRAIRFVQEA